MKIKRVQGDAWRQLRKKHKLTLLCVSASKSNNWRADLIDENGRRYSHWLGDSERDKIMQSTYFQTHKIVDSNDVYNPQSEVHQLLVKKQEANLSEVPCYPDPEKGRYPF